jgi:hypothetical protein
MYTLRPSFYESTLKGKMLRDTDSEEMLDIILNSRTYDLGRIYDWGGITGTLYSISEQSSFTYVSAIEKKTAIIQEAIDKIIADFAS